MKKTFHSLLIRSLIACFIIFLFSRFLNLMEQLFVPIQSAAAVGQLQTNDSGYLWYTLLNEGQRFIPLLYIIIAVLCLARPIVELIIIYMEDQHED